MKTYVTRDGVLDIGDGDVVIADSVTATVNGIRNLISVAGNDRVTVTGPQMAISLVGAYSYLLTKGDTEAVTLTAAAFGNTVELDGQQQTVTVAGSRNALTVNGDGSTLAVTGLDNVIFINGRNNAATVANTNNTIVSSGSTVTFQDRAGGTVDGGGATVVVGSQDTVSARGDGHTLHLDGNNSRVSVNGSFVVAFVAGVSNTLLMSGDAEIVVVAGQANTARVLAGHSRVDVYGTGQDVQISGGILNVADGARLVLDGTAHNAGNTPDLGNGNMVRINLDVVLTATGSNNYVLGSARDTVTFTDWGNGFQAAGAGNVVTFASTGNTPSTGDYAILNASTLNLAAGVVATLSGAGNIVSLAAGASLTAGSAAADPVGFAVKGFAYDSYVRGGFQTAGSAASLRTLAATGANAVELVVTQYTRDLTTPIIAATNQTESDASLQTAIAQAQANGLRILLKPHVDPADGAYRAKYSFADPDGFFAGYKDFIVHYAQIAQASHVGMLSIGSELQSLTGAAYTARWDDIIAAVRQVYTGQLTYASAYGETAQIQFWDRLDVIGVNPYEPLTALANPTLAQLDAGWTQTPTTALNTATAITPYAFYQGLSAATGKPILFTEIGYRSVNGTNALAGQSGAYDPATTSFYPYAEYQQQGTALQALFQTFGHAAFVQGAYLWEWKPDPNQVQTDDFSVQGKPALAVVKQAFGTGATTGADNNVFAVGAGASLILTGAYNIVTAADGALGMISGTGNTLAEAGRGAAFNMQNTGAGTDTVTFSGAGDYIGLLGGQNYALSGSGGSVATWDNTGFSLSGNANQVYLARGDVVNLTGSANTVTAAASDLGNLVGTGNTLIEIGANSVFNVQNTGGGIDRITSQGMNGYTGLIGGAGYQVTASNGVVATTDATAFSLRGDANQVYLGSGDMITLDGTADVINGLDHVVAYLNGSANVLALGPQANIQDAGSGDRLTVGPGSNLYVTGNNDSVVLLGGVNTVNMAGSGGMVFLDGAQATIADNGSGLHVVVDATGGTILLFGLGTDPTAVIRLAGGVGGYTSTTQAMDALAADGNGGTRLSLGGAGSLDFANVTPSMLGGGHVQVV